MKTHESTQTFYFKYRMRIQYIHFFHVKIAFDITPLDVWTTVSVCHHLCVLISF